MIMQTPLIKLLSSYLLKNMFCRCIKKALQKNQLCIKQIRPDVSLDYIKRKICNRYKFPSSYVDLKPQVVGDNGQEKYRKTSVRQRKIAYINFAYTEMLVPVLMDRDHDFFKKYYG